MSCCISISKNLNFGDVILIVGDCRKVGWGTAEGIQMKWNPGDIWTADIDCCLPMTYKYVIVREYDRQIVQWEDGDNRQITQYGKIEDIWGSRLLKIVLHVKSEESVYLNLLGQLNQQIQMTKSLMEDSATIAFHTTQFQIPTNLINSLRYKYSTDTKWERGETRSVSKKQKNATYRNNVLYVQDYDLNLSLNFDQITKHIYVGAYLYEEDLPTLQALGVDAILNLQDFYDLEQRQMPQTHFYDMETLAKEHSILYVHYGIQDSNKMDYIKKGLNATRLFKNLLENGRTVYIHCTSGIQRSIQTIILYLVLHQGFELESALSYVQRKRKRAIPFLDVLRLLIDKQTLISHNKSQF